MGPQLEKALLAYAALSSAAIGWMLISGAAPARSRLFDEIKVHRIDVVEPDGTLRMVISNKDRIPGVIVHGREQPRTDRPQAGMIFYNDEGTENGGLIFSGRMNAKGEVVDSGGSLSFDRYGGKEVVQVAGVDDKDNRFAGLAVRDQNRRIWVGRADDGTASVALMDPAGHKRIVMQVSASGEPSLEFLDANGRSLRRMTRTATERSIRKSG